ncbi:EF-Tu/IF-2/RF-3 family GTPase [Kribbella sp. NPDC051587]|uniref:EF-Tu/IF-2/RF-3 family GTPase n=1 Tax=Kribbella sp. NPDC051587 TaxID=3364119 RepID=UPI00379C6AB3
MSWKFWKRENPMDPQVLLAKAHEGRPQDLAPPGEFGMAIEDVFTITGRGTVVTGRVLSGSAAVGDQVVVSRAGQMLLQTQIDAIEMFRKTTTVANAGDNVGLLLRGLGKDQVTRGDVIGK